LIASLEPSNIFSPKLSDNPGRHPKDDLDDVFDDGRSDHAACIVEIAQVLLQFLWVEPAKTSSARAAGLVARASDFSVFGRAGSGLSKRHPAL
jgi:hypothetical protein